MKEPRLEQGYIEHPGEAMEPFTMLGESGRKRTEAENKKSPRISFLLDSGDSISLHR